MVTKDLGMVTAYAYAVAGGYTGTEAEFTQLMADLAVVVDDFDNFSVNVTTLPAGSSATASYADGVLSLGIPKGDKGDKGNAGDTGASAGFGTVSATVDDTIGTPSVEVTASGSDTAKNFAFAFHNLKGEKGDKGDTGEVSEAELAEALEDFAENGTVANAEQLTTDIRANDQTPYLFRTSGGSLDIGDREYLRKIVGASVGWNQLADAPPLTTASTTKFKSGCSFVSGHKMLFYFNPVVIDAQGSTPQLWFYERPIGASENTSIKVGQGVSYSIISCPATMVANGSANVEGGVWTYTNTSNMSSYFCCCFDLTQMFGATIADYIYSLKTTSHISRTPNFIGFILL